MHTRIFCCLLFCFWSGIQSAQAAPVDAKIRGFFTQHCLKCHGPQTQEADFRVDTMLKVSQTASDAEYWQLVLDNLNLGVMPPEDQPQPKTAEVQAVTKWIDEELRRARRVLAGNTGEVVLRRLNRTEYEYTIQDLFGVRGKFADGFPADGSQEGFDNNGAALVLSAEQINQYLHAADSILDRAIQTQPRPKPQRAVFSLHDFNQEAWERSRQELERRKQNFDQLTPQEQERTREMIKNFKENPNAGYSFPVVDNGELRAPTPEDGTNVDGVIAIKAGYAAPTTRNVFRTRYPGWYRFQISAYAVKNQGQPVRLKISYGSFQQGTIANVADVIYLTKNTPQEFEYKLYFQPNQHVKIELLDGSNWARREDQIKLPGPFAAIRSMEMEGPLLDQWPPRGHQLLLGQRDAKKLQDEEIPVILGELAPKLFRRPVAASVVQDFVDFYKLARRQEQPLEAFKLTVKAMMASPYFVYHLEVGDQPDDYAIANRLSYFLWRSAPDAELYQLAASGALSQPTVVQQQVDRMLVDPKSERFLKDFVGKWLKIDLVGEMQPDSNLYPEYDDALERGMVAETEGFIRELLHNNLSLLNLIDSDWAMLNDRMARHYGIAGVSGNDVQRVPLDKSKTVRGGLLTQASILNVTSNGTTTSPVVRGVWVLERLLGTPAPPPPPDVPAIEPDIRGASTIQEQLARHRSITQCASCHKKIDPYGMALENFDVIGGWRENYRALEITRNPNRPKLVDGPEVIASDALPRGDKFDDFRAFRRLLLEKQDLVFKNMAHQLATFALGRVMDFADEADLEHIAEATQAKGGGMKTMIHELVASNLFRRP